MTADLLSILADGHFHSGPELGERLGVSRTAVWKQLKKLEAEGLPVNSVKGKGYRLAAGIRLLQESLFAKGLNPRARAAISHCHLQLATTSTNAEAMLAIQQGCGSGELFLAEAQTAGRGRRGKSWVSPFGRNLYFSLVWNFSGGAAALEGLSLAVGVSLATALSKLGYQGLGLKWPNDLWLQGKKLGGILLEMTGDASGYCQVVIGVGINVDMSHSTGNQIDQPWTSLSSQGVSPDRNQLLSAILNQLVADLVLFSEQGFTAFMERWVTFDVCVNRSVTLLEHQSQLTGVARGVDCSGALLFEHDATTRAVHGGEISLRLREVCCNE